MGRGDRGTAAQLLNATRQAARHDTGGGTGLDLRNEPNIRTMGRSFGEAKDCDRQKDNWAKEIHFGPAGGCLQWCNAPKGRDEFASQAPQTPVARRMLSRWFCQMSHLVGSGSKRGRDRGSYERRGQHGPKTRLSRSLNSRANQKKCPTNACGIRSVHGRHDAGNRQVVERDAIKRDDIMAVPKKAVRFAKQNACSRLLRSDRSDQKFSITDNGIGEPIEPHGHSRVSG